MHLQFSSKNPYSHFTSNIKVQYKIQRRQLRAAHSDDHYCAAQLKYLKEKAIEMKEATRLLFCDDNAKVLVGEPGTAVSIGVRGRMSIVPTSTTLGALHHDMQSKASLVLSVTLECNIPNAIDESFVRGEVHTAINNAVFQVASGFRKAAAPTSNNIVGKIGLVKCASISIFKELNLDMYILARCASGHSWINPAERIMSLLNLALQNVSLEHQQSSEATEKALKKL